MKTDLVESWLVSAGRDRRPGSPLRVPPIPVLVRHGTSPGAVESTIERRASIPGQEHLPQTLLRLSIRCSRCDRS